MAPLLLQQFPTGVAESEEKDGDGLVRSVGGQGGRDGQEPRGFGVCTKAHSCPQLLLGLSPALEPHLTGVLLFHSAVLLISRSPKQRRERRGQEEKESCSWSLLQAVTQVSVKIRK